MGKRRLRSALIALAVASGAACAASSATDSATITYCVPGTGTEKPRALGGVRNASSETSSFFVLIEFRDSAGDLVTDGMAVVNDVEPRMLAPFDITGRTGVGGPLTCEVGTVRRSAEL